MQKNLKIFLVLAVMMAGSTHALAEAGSAGQMAEFNEGRIEASQADIMALKELLAERLQTLGALLEGNGDAKIGTMIDTKLEILQTREMGPAELIQEINKVNILIHHVQNN